MPGCCRPCSVCHRQARPSTGKTIHRQDHPQARPSTGKTVHRLRQDRPPRLPLLRPPAPTPGSPETAGPPPEAAGPPLASIVANWPLTPRSPRAGARRPRHDRGSSRCRSRRRPQSMPRPLHFPN
eukprot:scaffold22623_cov56-Phaeocystis_antarctica.AAC.2